MAVTADRPPFTPIEESLTSSLRDRIRELEAELADERVENERLRCELDLADLTIDRYSRGLM